MDGGAELRAGVSSPWGRRKVGSRGGETREGAELFRDFGGVCRAALHIRNRCACLSAFR